MTDTGNKNIDWVDGKGVWLVYIGLCFLFRFAIGPFCTEGDAWTITHAVHTIGTFYLWHWLKGSPIPEDSHKYAKLTWWEQLDQGVMFTSTKKFFTIWPVCLFLIATHYNDYALYNFTVNLVFFGFAFVPKLPEMHKVRLFGINAEE